MTTKLVIRLLGPELQLLGWTEHMATARGDGQLWSTSDVNVRADVGGKPALVSVHWADVNVETKSRISFPDVRPGQVVRVLQSGRPVLKVGEPASGLPAVTVGSVTVGVPVGGTMLVGAA